MRKSLIITVIIALLCLCGCEAAVTVPESPELTRASEMLLTTTAAEESTDNRIQEMHILWTPEEYDLLTQRMSEAGVINRSAFVRKMALDGYILKLDMADIHEMIRLLRNATNNLNQMAKQANSTGNIYGAEISDMQQKQDEIWETSKEILARLAAVQ